MEGKSSFLKKQIAIDTGMGGNVDVVGSTSYTDKNSKRNDLTLEEEDVQHVAQEIFPNLIWNMTIEEDR